MALQTEPFVRQKFCILTININKTTMKTRLLLYCLLLLTANALWAQSDKRPQPSGQIQQLYERYKQNQTLSKEEYNLLSPYLAEMPADLSEPQAQNRTIGVGGTPQTNLVSTAYVFSQAVQTYTPITGGTVLGTGTGVDDNNYIGQDIGFTFNYDGVNYATLGVNSNGFVWFGTTAPATNNFAAISNTAPSGSRIIAALSGDLRGGTSGELRIQTIGTAPNRICVVQWTNFQHYRSHPCLVMITTSKFGSTKRATALNCTMAHLRKMRNPALTKLACVARQIPTTTIAGLTGITRQMELQITKTCH
jgi:hypothetical protein